MITTTLNTQIIVGAILTGLVLVVVFVAGLLNIRGAQGPRERRFIILVTPVLWVMVLVFVASMYLLQPPSRYVSLAAFFFIIPFFMYRCTLRRLMIRELESRTKEKAESAS